VCVLVLARMHLPIFPHSSSYDSRGVGILPTGEGSSHALLLENRVVLSPLGAPVVVPTEALAAIIATEWDYQVCSCACVCVFVCAC
jgi:hypothetical protein